MEMKIDHVKRDVHHQLQVEAAHHHDDDNNFKLDDLPDEGTMLYRGGSCVVH